jgi:CubicO group peptidase (beta-lactamase class C family)
MAQTIKLLDMVALTVDLPEYDLWRGQVGTVVDVIANGSTFEVEFSDRQGRTYESLGLRLDPIIVLRYASMSKPSTLIAELAR